MRPEDLRNYRTLRRLVDNPWEVLRFRTTRRPGQTLTVRMREGGPLYLRGGHTDFHIFHRIFLRDEYRLDAVAVGAWSCVVDLGANVGLFSARAAPLAQRVIAYEPHAGNFACLERNLAGRPNVVRVQAAVAGTAGTLRLHHPEHEGLSGIYSAYREEGRHLSSRFEEVRAETLDQLFESHGIEVCDLLKIDVEGAEYEILHAASSATLERVHRIHGEYHDVARDDPRTRIGSFVKFLEGLGFTVELDRHRRRENLGLFYAERPGLSTSRPPRV
ncbi:MAG: FkbM family methyltransferase [Myxococcota bacterium]